MAITTGLNRVDVGEEPVDELAGRHPLVAVLMLQGQRLALLGVLIGLWALLSGRVLKTFWVSSPSAVYQQLIDWSHEGLLVTAGRTTLQEMVEGFVLGALAGIVVGCVLGWWRRVGEVVNPFIIAVNSIPKIAIAPLLILWLGIGMRMKVTLTAVIVFFLVFYNTFTGVREVERELIETVRVMGAKRRTVFRYVVLPSALAMVFAGLRVSVPYAFLGAVVGEMLASNQGVGFLIMNASAQFNTAGVFAGLVVLMVLASIINGLVGLVEKRLLRWKGSQARH